MKNFIHESVIPLNWIDKSDRFALVPGYQNRKPVRRIKQLDRAKGNCMFGRGVPAGMIDFIYRSVVKLKLTEKKLIFSRGQVKKKNLPVVNAVAVCELPWDCGTSIKIPKLLRYNKTIKLKIDREEHVLRLMELIVLSALLKIAYPHKSSTWYSNMTAFILAKGWPQFDINKAPEVFVI